MSSCPICRCVSIETSHTDSGTKPSFSWACCLPRSSEDICHQFVGNNLKKGVPGATSANRSLRFVFTVLMEVVERSSGCNSRTKPMYCTVRIVRAQSGPVLLLTAVLCLHIKHSVFSFAAMAYIPVELLEYTRVQITFLYRLGRTSGFDFSTGSISVGRFQPWAM